MASDPKYPIARIAALTASNEKPCSPHNVKSFNGSPSRNGPGRLTSRPFSSPSRRPPYTRGSLSHSRNKCLTIDRRPSDINTLWSTPIRSAIRRFIDDLSTHRFRLRSRRAFYGVQWADNAARSLLQSGYEETARRVAESIRTWADSVPSVNVLLYATVSVA